MNKSLYEFCQRKFKTSTAGKLKLSGLLKRLHNDYSFGVIDGDYLHFTEKHREFLIEQVQSENGVHLFRAPYPVSQSRHQIAQTQRNEKTHSHAVSRDFVLINSLQSLQINTLQLPLLDLTTLGMYLKADEITSVEHKQIVMVENLEIMANLTLLNIPDSLKNALWLYRGDIKKQQKTSSAYQFFRRFKESHQLICFSDLDPKGIEIALSSDAHYWLTAEDSKVINIDLHGDEHEWFNQQAAIKYLQSRDDLPQKCQSVFTQMKNDRKTLKQEHMLKHNISLKLYEL